MNGFQKLGSAVMAGITAFREVYFSSGMDDVNFTDFEARKMRYALLWAMVENNAYRNIKAWARQYKADYGLYKFIRGIYNPAYRLSDFWKTHLLGGRLDMLAGDGSKTPSALPITTKNEKLRPAIAQLWLNSNWQIKKDVLSMWGATLGDAGIKIIDDPLRGKCYLKLVHPGKIKSMDVDDFGNVKGYELEEKLPDPRPKASANSWVRYGEKASRDGSNVVYETFLDDKPYAWDGEDSTWSEPYGFIPFVAIQHNNVGLEYGWAELYPDLPKFREIDDLASKLSDQIRKLVDAPWLMAGVKQSEVNISSPASNGTTEAQRQKGRQEVPLIFTNDPNAKAQHLVAPLDIPATTAHIESLLENIEADYPELSANLKNVSENISGRALRINQAPAADKVEQRRPNYDWGIIKAHQMGIAIGGMRKYKGFDGFDLASYEAGELDHAIGERPVFSKDPMDDIEEEKEFWTTAELAKKFGIPPLMYLEEKGWSKKQIEKITNSAEYKLYITAMEMAANPGEDLPPQRKSEGANNRANGKE